MKKLLFVLFVLTSLAALCFSVGAEGYTITTEEETKTVSYLQAADATGDGRYSTVTLK